MIYKYLFYSVSYVIKKYDRLWNVGNDYFLWGAMAVGGIIAITIYNIMEIISLIIYHNVIPPSKLMEHFCRYFPLVLGIISCVCFRYKRRCDRIYEAIKKMPKRRKRIYKVLNLVHVIFTFAIMFAITDISREINLGDGAFYAPFLVKLFGLG